MTRTSRHCLLFLLSSLSVSLGACGGGYSSGTPPPPPPPPGVNSVTHLFFNPPTVVGGAGANSTGTVVLSAAASGTVTVTLANSDPTDVTVPASVMVPNGATSATFTATASAVASQKIVTITATFNGSINNTLRVNPPLTSTLIEHVIIAGETTSPDFPTTLNAFQPTTTSTDTAWAGSIIMTTQINGTLTAAKDFVTYIGNKGLGFGGLARDSFVDANGNVYVCGLTSDNTFNTLPQTAGVSQPNFAGGYHDAFIAKFNSSGTLQALTYLGGATGPVVSGKTTGETAETICYNIFVDSGGFVYVGGRTSTSDIRATAGVTSAAFQTTYGGGNAVPSHWGGDFWIAKLNPNFQGRPIWMTYVGGMDDDGGRGRIAADSAGNVIIGGFGKSTSNFPTPSGTLPNLTNVNNFGAVLKISADGSKLLYSALVFGHVSPPARPGTTVTNASGGVILDAAGDAYVCGFTTATDAIAASGAPLTGFQTVNKGGANAYVAKISPTGQILAMTLIGGSGTSGTNTEECKGLGFDSEGNVVMYTPSNSPDYPTTPGVFQTMLLGTSNIAVTKFTPDLSQVIFSTYVGGSGDEEMDAGQVELDQDDNMWFAFLTTSTDLPARGVVTPNAVQTMFGAKSCPAMCSDAAFVKLSADGSKILFGSYLGGSGADNTRTSRYHKN